MIKYVYLLVGLLLAQTTFATTDTNKAINTIKASETLITYLQEAERQGRSIDEAFVSAMIKRPGQTPVLLKSVLAVYPQKAKALVIASMVMMPAQAEAILTAAISQLAKSDHPAIYELALSLGLSEQQALLAALDGGADPSVIGSATAAGFSHVKR